MKRFALCLAGTWGVIAGWLAWTWVLRKLVGDQAAFTIIMLNVVALMIAALVWAVWGMFGDKEEEEKEETPPPKKEYVPPGCNLYADRNIEPRKVVREYVKASDSTGEWVVREYNDGSSELFWREKREKKVRLVSVKHDMRGLGVEVVIEYDDGSVSKRKVSEEEVFGAGGYDKWYAELERSCKL